MPVSSHPLAPGYSAPLHPEAGPSLYSTGTGYEANVNEQTYWTYQAPIVHANTAILPGTVAESGPSYLPYEPGLRLETGDDKSFAAPHSVGRY